MYPDRPEVDAVLRHDDQKSGQAAASLSEGSREGGGERELPDCGEVTAVLSLHPAEVQGDLPGAHPERAGGQLLHDLLQHLQRHPQALPPVEGPGFFPLQILT